MKPVTSMCWLNPFSGELAVSDTLTGVDPFGQGRDNWLPTSFVAAGYRCTVAGAFVYDFDPEIQDIVLVAVDAVVLALDTPNIDGAGTVLPMRMTQRNDGYGADERHSRIRTMREEKASSSTASNRIHSFGSSNTYD